MPTCYKPKAISSPSFSVQTDDPFIIFQKLQNCARAARGESDVIDLSRGDPGYGFTPSVRGREFASYVLWLDTMLNVNADDRFLRYQEDDQEKILDRITEITQKTYQAETARHLEKLLHEFTNAAIGMAEAEGKKWNMFDVLWQLFAYCSMSGGSYLLPHGQELTRIIVAAWHQKELDVKIESDDIILTSGASHAIGTLFKALGEEGCGFLKKGDSVAIASPVYAPYNRMIEERGLLTLPFSIDPLSGELAAEDLNALQEGGAKALFLIDPNNPTGFSLSTAAIGKLAEIAKKKDMLVITDEVYSSFFPKKKTMLSLAPERTICINARSKIERSTGLRFGEIITLPEGRAHMASMLKLSDAEEWGKLLVFSKAPGRTGGQFQHTTFVPGPSQLLGIAHIVLGKSERETYLLGLQENRDLFCQELSLPHKGNNYYIIFDLDALPGCVTQNIPIEERLLSLAEAGVVYIPAYRFFSEKDRGKTGILTSVRASVVNTTAERLVEATRRTKEVLC